MAFTLTGIAPSYLTYFDLIREITPGFQVVPQLVAGGVPAVTGPPAYGAGGTYAVTVPMEKSTFEPEDKPMWLKDQAIRGSMADLFNVIQGVEIASWNLGGPVYLDADGLFLDNVFGDLATTATGGTFGTLQLLTAVAAGATSITVASAIPTVAGSVLRIVDPVTAKNEVVIASGPNVTTTIPITGTPLRFAHGATASAALLTSGNPAYAHTFAPLNSGNGQPPTDSFADYTGLQQVAALPAGAQTNTTGARIYAGSCVGQMDFTISAEQLFTKKVGATSIVSSPVSTVAGAIPAKIPTSIVPVPAWVGTCAIATSAFGGATPVGTALDFAEIVINIKRELQVYFTVQGSQNPYIIARGPVSVTGTIKYAPSVDEVALTNMLMNLQPALTLTISNAATVPPAPTTASIVFNMAQVAYTTAKVVRSGVLVGYDVQFECVANTTNVGGSGGLSPISIVLTNAVPTY